MFTQAQLEYIEKQFGRKVSREDIIKKLAAAGWENGDIEDGLREVEKKLSKPKEGEVPPLASHTLRTVLLIIGGAVLIAAIGGLAYWKYVWLPKQAPKTDTQIAVPVTEEKVEVNIFDATTTPDETVASRLSPMWGDWKGETIVLLPEGGPSVTEETNLAGKDTSSQPMGLKVPKFSEVQLNTVKEELQNQWCDATGVDKTASLKQSLINNIGVPETVSRDELWGMVQIHPQLSALNSDIEKSCEDKRKQLDNCSLYKISADTPPVSGKPVSLSGLSVSKVSLKELSQNDAQPDVTFQVKNPQSVRRIVINEVFYKKGNKTPLNSSAFSGLSYPCGVRELYIDQTILRPLKLSAEVRGGEDYFRESEADYSVLDIFAIDGFMKESNHLSITITP